MRNRIIAVFCAAVLMFLLPGCGEKAAEEPNFDGYSIYQVSMEEDNSDIAHVIAIAPFDAVRLDLTEHATYVVETWKKAFPSLSRIYITYYESILFYKSGDTPVGDMVGKLWSAADPEDPGYQVYGTVYKHFDAYKLNEEERAVYAELQEYFLEEVGIPLVSTDDFTQEEVAGFERAAEALGYTTDELMMLTMKQFYWRPPDYYW